jgi:hypothetical protein
MQLSAAGIQTNIFQADGCIIADHHFPQAAIILIFQLIGTRVKKSELRRLNQLSITVIVRIFVLSGSKPILFGCDKAKRAQYMSATGGSEQYPVTGSPVIAPGIRFSGMMTIFTFLKGIIVVTYRLMRYLLIAGLCMGGFLSEAQDLNGFWKGSLTMTGCFPENNIELQIHISGNQISGDSYHYQNIYYYVKKKFNGSYDPTDKKLKLSENIVTTWQIPYHCVICIKEYELIYSRQGDVETLKGGWVGNIQNTATNCGPGTILLTRIKESAFKEIPEIKVDTGLLKLDFYDNAQIDGDSITVLVNKQVVLTHQRLTDTATTTYVRIDLSNTFVEVEMIAENLGKIPPNTALLVVTAGAKKYQLFLSSTTQKSARVRFLYEKEDPPSVTRQRL